jgi:glycosyltransferase involved in cell wall biosynthesis
MIGLVAIMLNEAEYVDRWLEVLPRMAQFGAFDHVVVIDGGSKDGTQDKLRAAGVTVVERAFANHFADQRNFAVEHCRTDWIFELDADEIPSTPLLAGLRDIARDADKSGEDSVGFVRLNVIDDVLVASPGHKGLDYQYRLHNRRCHWRGAVHEEVVGYRSRFEQPWRDGHFIIHDKRSGRHAERNAYYGTLTP